MYSKEYCNNHSEKGWGGIMIIAIIAFTIGVIAGVILTCVIHKEKPYDTERVEIEIANYFKNVINI